MASQKRCGSSRENCRKASRSVKPSDFMNRHTLVLCTNSEEGCQIMAAHITARRSCRRISRAANSGSTGLLAVLLIPKPRGLAARTHRRRLLAIALPDMQHCTSAVADAAAHSRVDEKDASVHLEHRAGPARHTALEGHAG